MKKIILSLFALMSTLGIGAQTTSDVEVIRIYSSERTGDAAAWPVAEYQNSTDSTYSAELQNGIITIYNITNKPQTVVNVWKNHTEEDPDDDSKTIEVNYRVELRKFTFATDGGDGNSDYVNLGLKSGTLWAKNNVGATSEIGCGKYYAWGETKAYDEVPGAYPQNTSKDWASTSNKNYESLIKSNTSKNGNYYGWTYYKWSDGLSEYSYNLTKYTNSSNLTLEAADDAATVNWNSNWSMPTNKQINELADDTYNYALNLNGMQGYRFVSKSDSRRYIFLPCAGVLQQGQGDTPTVGGIGSYWSKDCVNKAYGYAYDLAFSKWDESLEAEYFERALGYSVRPVYSSVTVEPVTSITLSDASVSCLRTITLTPTVLPTNATFSNVTWTSSNTSVATVNALGEVTGVSEGTATITAAATDGSEVTGSCTVTVETVKLESVSLSSTQEWVSPASTAVLTATITPAGASYNSVTWSSSDESIAKVSETGVVTGEGYGNVTITVTVSDGTITKTATYDLKAIVPVTSIAVENVTGNTGGVAYLSATVNPSNAQNDDNGLTGVTWTITDPSGTLSLDKLTLNGSNVDIAYDATPGDYTITATATDGTEVTGTGTLTVVVPVSTLGIDKTETTVAIGGTTTLSPVFTPTNATDRDVTWYSSDESIAEVSQSGVVTAKAAGTAYITVKLYSDPSNKYAACKVIVTATATTGTAKAKLTVGDDTETDVTWVQLWENGPKWATFNVGAESVSDYGGYYTWGGTTTQSDASYYNGTTYTDGNIPSDYDTATQLWGSNWKMPSETDYANLVTNCNVEWTADYNGTGVAGRIYTGKNSFSSNSVFFPAAGFYVVGYGAFETNLQGCYWTSTPYDKTQSYYMKLLSDSQDPTWYDVRNSCSSVRAILK